MGYPCHYYWYFSLVNLGGSHKYDPYRPLESDKAPLTIQVMLNSSSGSLFILNKTLRLLTKYVSQKKLR